MPEARRQSRIALHRQVQRGLPFSAFKRVQARSGLPGNRLTRVVQVPARTLERRRRSGRFNPAESERILRLERLIELAEKVFDGDRIAASHWLTSPNLVLGDHTPLDLASTEVGAREVEDVLLRTQAGIYS